MLNRMLTSVALFFLPSVDSILDGIHAAMVKLDKIVVTLDKRAEDQAVRLAQHNTQRREAMEAVERTYERRAGQTLDTLAVINRRAAEAEKARNRVADFLSE